MANLEGVPLTFLDLSDCNELTDATLRHLWKLPITKLKIYESRMSLDCLIAFWERNGHHDYGDEQVNEI